MSVADELQTLRHLHTTLQAAAREVARVGQEVTDALTDTVWTGANAQRFKESWETFRPTLDPQLAQALEDAKDDVRLQHNNLAVATGEDDRI